MELTIVSGLSGSGKSTALNTLEDLGYYCIDNLPISLLPQLAQHLCGGKMETCQHAAVGIDVRNWPQDLQRCPEIIQELQQAGVQCRLVFLRSEPSVLLERFSETRRRHPLTDRKLSLANAIELERELLEPLISMADLYIDTTRTNVHQLRDLIRERLSTEAKATLSLLFQSFGYKHGVPSDADYVYDIRCLPNPHWEPILRPLTGMDAQVIAFLEKHSLVIEMFNELTSFLDRWIPRFEANHRSYLTVSIGCTGGQHRSVYMAEHLANHYRMHGKAVLTRHRELSWYTQINPSKKGAFS